MVPRPRAHAATPAIPRRRFTTAEYHRMVEAGVRTKGDRVELLDGHIIEMRPIGRPHARTVARFDTLLVRPRDVLLGVEIMASSRSRVNEIIG